ncbi:MAG: hypothetical protein V1755_08570, partial [Chloroflexota bacterium]
MKITDLLADAGRPVAYYPRLREISGSTNAALLLCQLIYWCGKQQDSAGWIHKRTKLADQDPDAKADPANQSLPLETGLSYKELKAARRLLRARGLLRERRDYIRHRLYFQVDLQVLQSAWQKATGESVPRGQVVGAQRSPSGFSSGSL